MNSSLFQLCLETLVTVMFYMINVLILKSQLPIEIYLNSHGCQSDVVSQVRTISFNILDSGLSIRILPLTFCFTQTAELQILCSLAAWHIQTIHKLKRF